MAINGFLPSIYNVIEQKNYIETKLRKGMRPAIVFRAAVSRKTPEYFDGRIGQSKTFTRSNPIAPKTAPLDPSTNTGLDNGITPAIRGFEQWSAVLSKWADGTDVNLPSDETLAGSVYIDDLQELGAAAINSMELVCANRAFEVYDTGDSFAAADVSSSTTLLVDNIKGFDTQYTTTIAPSFGLPAPVSSSNAMPIMVIHTDGTIVAHANVINAVADNVNASYMISAGDQLGASGTLTLDAAISCSHGDRVVAMDRLNPSTSAFNAIYKDGSFVVRPVSGGRMRGSAFEMTSSDLMVPSVMIPSAVSLLERRKAPKLRNGLYGCAIDSTLLGQFYQDDGFLKATATKFDGSPVYTEGVIAKGWGVEFIPVTQVPVYLAPTGGFPLRHAFVFGEDVVSEHPFAGAKNARSVAAQAGDNVDVRWVDNIQFITQAPLDRLNEVVKISYKYMGDFRPGTDKGTNPLSIRTSDFCRWKRGVMCQASAPF